MKTGGRIKVNFGQKRSLVPLIFTLVCLFATGEFGYRTERILAQAPSSTCITCHSSQADERLSNPTKLFDHDVHKGRGLSCVDCHGGDPTQEDKAAAKSLMRGYLGKPTPAQIPAFCGKCHSDALLMKKFNPSLRIDQVQEYYTSVHGLRLRSGDQRVATCVSCHGIHGIRKPEDPQSTVFPLNVAETCAKCHADAGRMEGYGIAHDQYDRYRSSVHAKALYEKHDLSAPTCNDCHGNHGAVPPGLDSVANVCGQCHGRQAELFRNSPHKGPFDAMKRGECLQCHRNHDIIAPTDAMAGVGEGSVCISCHSGDRGFDAAQRISAGLEKLSVSISHATDILDRAEHAGMEVSKPKFELQESTDALTQARVLVHTASPEEVGQAIAPGMEVAARSFQAGESAFEELSFRRRGLVVSLIFILFLAALVILKIRQIEGRSPFAKAS